MKLINQLLSFQHFRRKKRKNRFFPLLESYNQGLRSLQPLANIPQGGTRRAANHTNQ